MSTYPDDAQLHGLRTYAGEDRRAWLQQAVDAWSYPDRAVWRDDSLYLSTGGWSGNEEIIDSMRRNVVMWTMTWRLHRAGGHWWFWAGRLDKAEDEIDRLRTRLQLSMIEHRRLLGAARRVIASGILCEPGCCGDDCGCDSIKALASKDDAQEEE